MIVVHQFLSLQENVSAMLWPGIKAVWIGPMTHNKHNFNVLANIVIHLKMLQQGIGVNFPILEGFGTLGTVDIAWNQPHLSVYLRKKSWQQQAYPL